MRINANARGHRMALAAKIATQRKGVAMVIRAHRELASCTSHLAIGGHLRVALTRVAPCELDSHDNLRTAFKPVVDGLVDGLGLKADRDRRLDFVYAQAKGAPKSYAVLIEIEPAGGHGNTRQKAKDDL